MQYVDFGRTGLRVSRLGFGGIPVQRIDEPGTRAMLKAAHEAGINYIDTARAYTVSEEWIGQALEELGLRDEFILATKCRALTKAEMEAELAASLKNLRTDHIDLYQMHCPDPTTPIAETLDTLAGLVAEGTVRYIGCSNFAAWQVTEAHWAARELGIQGFISAQNEYSLYNRSAEDELVPACERFGIGVLPYFPLAYGLLTGKYRRGEAAPAGSRLEAQAKRLENADWGRIEALQAFADARDISLLTLAVGGLAAQPAVGSTWVLPAL